ncbi:MAG: polysaccharide lyase family 8 super-sandwich domain-containing protein [Sandaracinaceae bacterium]
MSRLTPTLAFVSAGLALLAGSACDPGHLTGSDLDAEPGDAAIDRADDGGSLTDGGTRADGGAPPDGGVAAVDAGSPPPPPEVSCDVVYDPTVTSLAPSDFLPRIRSFLIGEGADPTDPRVADALADVRGRAVRSSDRIGSDGSFADVDYLGSDNDVATHTARLRELAYGYATPGQPSYRSAALRADIERALSYLGRVQVLRDCTYPMTPECAWAGYVFTMTVPLDLATALVLVEGEVSSASFDAGMEVLLSHARPPSLHSRSNYNAGATWIGAMIAALTRDEAAMREVRQVLEMLLTPNDYSSSTRRTGSVGLKPDYAYLDHEATLYTAGYGTKEYASNVARYLYVMRGTDFAVSEVARDHFARFAADGILEAIYGRTFDPSVMGRVQNDGVESRTRQAREALLLVAAIPSPSQCAVVAGLRAHLARYDGGFGIEVAPLVGALDASEVEGRWPANHRHYPFADFTVHRRPSYYLSIKGLSDRSLTSDTVGHRNVLGALGTDGRMHLVLSGDEYAGDVLPTLDWTRLSGVTVQQRPGVERLSGQPSGNPDGPGGAGWPGRTSFVGGVSDGFDGVSAMDFAPPFSPELHAHKSWFFFGDYVVFVTDQIRDTSGHPVETVVDQRPLVTSDAPVHVDGVSQPTALGWSAALGDARWLTANGVGYHFPRGAGDAVLRATRARRSGAWSDMGSGSSTRVESDLFTLYFDHGARPDGASATYVVVPNQDAASMPRWVESTRLTEVAATPSITAFADLGTGLFGAVFWQPGAVEVPGSLASPSTARASS